MIEQFEPPFRMGGAMRRPRGIAMLYWLQESTVRTAPPASWVPHSHGGYAATGWLLWVEDRGDDRQHTFGMGPAEFEKRRSARRWEWAPRDSKADQVSALLSLSDEHVAGRLRPDWTLMDVTVAVHIHEYVLFEHMLPRMAALAAAWWSTVPERQRRVFASEAAAAADGQGRWRYA